jgi:hypothetical protein
LNFKGFFHFRLGWYAIWYATEDWLLLDHSGHRGACKWRASALLVGLQAGLLCVPVDTEWP